jgi:hypothetical protein
MSNQIILELDGLIASLNYLIPQLGGFVAQFNDIQVANAVTVISDPTGGLFLDVPRAMPESVEKILQTKLGIIDRLCNTQSQSISELLDKGGFLENQLKLQNPNYTSKISGHIAEFVKIQGAFKHRSI